MERLFYKNQGKVEPVAMHRTPRQHGAALIYALVAVLIISILIIGIGTLTSEHLRKEESDATFSRLIYSAEAAANWQLNRMSRLAPQKGIAGAGQVYFGDLNTQALSLTDNTNWSKLPPDYTGGLVNNDEVLVYTTTTNSSLSWTSPLSNFDIFAFARDPANPTIVRGVKYSGTMASLGERFSLFGQDGLTFQSANASQVCTLTRGYVGSNGIVSYTNAPPQAIADTNNSAFSGLMLGGDKAALNPNVIWPSNWDIPRLPESVSFPTIPAIMQGLYPSRTMADLNSTINNANARAGAIQYWNGTTSRFEDFAAPVTQLTTQAEFAKSNFPSNASPLYHVIRLKTALNDPSGNLFVFNTIQMGPNDILILDKDPAQTPQKTACRILLNGSVTKDSLVTNIALYQVTVPVTSGGKPLTSASAYLWYNNTNKGLTFQPNLDAATDLNAIALRPEDSGLPYKPMYMLAPGVPGMAYGIRDNSPGGGKVPGSGSTGGSITVDATIYPPNSSVPVTILTVIANQVKITGKITVGKPQLKHGVDTFPMSTTTEEINDPFFYVMYYRITGNYSEININDKNPLLPFRDYGAAP